MLRVSAVIFSTFTPGPSSTSYRVTVGPAGEAGDRGVDVELLEHAGDPVDHVVVRGRPNLRRRTEFQQVRGRQLVGVAHLIQPELGRFGDLGVGIGVRDSGSDHPRLADPGRGRDRCGRRSRSSGLGGRAGGQRPGRCGRVGVEVGVAGRGRPVSGVMIGICRLPAPGRPAQPGGGQVGVGVERDLATGPVVVIDVRVVDVLAVLVGRDAALSQPLEPRPGSGRAPRPAESRRSAARRRRPAAPAG